MIILDTDVLIEIFDRTSTKGEEILQRLLKTGEDITTTAINLHEILCSMQKFAAPVKETLLLPVLDYTKKDAALSSKLEQEGERTGTPVRRVDAMMAAIAMNNGAALYTLDLKHYNGFKSLGLKFFI
jgi:tRNA(fMet)-specific endonuclease VapC